MTVKKDASLSSDDTGYISSPDFLDYHQDTTLGEQVFSSLAPSAVQGLH